MKTPRWLWLRLFLGGSTLFALTGVAVAVTGNPNFLPTVILLGAFIVPVSFVAYFYEYVRDRDISLPVLTASFIVGGVLGLVAAGVLEYGTLRTLSVGSLLGVGLIEESVKLIFPLIMYAGWRYRHEADGLLFGIAAGMGFAALETMGYGLVSLIQSRGDVGVLQQVLLLRGLLSPAGHAAWTGIVCAALWRQRERAGRGPGVAVFGAFVLVVLLHALWDILSSLKVQTTGDLIMLLGGLAMVAAVSLVLVVRRFVVARRSAEARDQAVARS